MSIAERSSSLALSVMQWWDDRIRVRAGGESGSDYLYRNETPKACVHPLTTPAGHVLTGFEPSDHVWHRGLWLAIKFVNGSNFWEELPPFGVQVTTTPPTSRFLSADVVRVDHGLAWESEATGRVLSEARALTFRQLEGGVRVVDWQSLLTAEQNLTLDRTPYTTWGGYGGLSWRGHRGLHEVKFTTPEGDVDALTGQSHDWAAMSARVDGGRDLRVSLAILDHPSNSVTPPPWYCKSGNGFTFMNAAFLFHGPMTLGKGQTLRLNYRVLYRDGQWTPSELAALSKSYREEGVNS